jgi:DNA-binding transcriptional MerR regulator/quercetin dioxygenase-like cupin family protein
METASRDRYLKIGDVARSVGISASAIRAWEELGLTRPQRTASRYRLYTAEDVKLLKRARFLREQRGLNAPAIVHMLERDGSVRPAPHTRRGAIGPRLRQLRLKKGHSLIRVARAVGISVGFLSAIERSQMSPSVATLRRLARFYKTNILEFFDAGESHSPLVSPRDRKVLEISSGVRMELLAMGHPVMEAHLFRVQPGAGCGESYTHAGEEFLYVMRGAFRIMLDETEYRLKTGDSFYFESMVPHRWWNPGKQQACVLWVNTPPTF